MNEAQVLFRALLVLIVGGQIVSFTLARNRKHRVASLLNGVSPLLVLGVALLTSGPWGRLSWFEISLLLMEGLTVVVSMVAVWIGRGIVPLFWLGWIFNLVAGIAIVYLAFFFSIHF